MTNDKTLIEKKTMLEKYCNNKDLLLYGYVTEIQKNKFFAMFDRDKMTKLELEYKKKKLNSQQKKLLCLGQILKLDFNDGKLYFMDFDKKWL